MKDVLHAAAPVVVASKTSQSILTTTGWRLFLMAAARLSFADSRARARRPSATISVALSSAERYPSKRGN